MNVIVTLVDRQVTETDPDQHECLVENSQRGQDLPLLGGTPTAGKQIRTNVNVRSVEAKEK